MAVVTVIFRIKAMAAVGALLHIPTPFLLPLARLLPLWSVVMAAPELVAALVE